jgi:Ca2+-binding RTX toxin-like protein
VRNGGAGNDTLNGGAGNDTLVGGLGADILDGGTGTNLADYSASTAGVSVNLQNGKGTGGAAQGDTLSNIQNLVGSAFADNLVGSSSANALNGAGGNDTLNGGGGADVLTGGAGADTFLFKTVGEIGLGATTDAITDFQAGGIGAATAIDHIDLSLIDANTKSTKDDAFTFIGSAAFTGKAGELRSDGAGHLLGDVNGDGIADFSLALTITGTLDGTDLIL